MNNNLQFPRNGWSAIVSNISGGSCLAASAVLACCWAAGSGQAAGLSNEAWRVELLEDGAAMVSTPAGTAVRFEPRFTVLQSSFNPGLSLTWGGFSDRSLKNMYNVETWNTRPGGKKAAKANPRQHVDDGFDPSVDRAGDDGTTCNIFRAGRSVQVTGKSALEEGRIVWSFSGQDGFTLAARLEVPPGREVPKLSWTFVPGADGWWSVGYTGAPEVDPAAMEGMWQPMIWQEKRFPENCFLTSAFRCPLPATFVAVKGVTSGVVADPVELPFQPLPRLDNSRFGVAVRNEAGRAQSMLFAPVLGGKGSQMKEGVASTFTVRLFACRGSCLDAYEHVARSVYGFRDYRVNSACSLNRTLENMIDYGMSEYSRFNADLRGCSYDTDMPGSVKNISSLHPFGLALVTDDEKIFVERARPMIEFALSREKFLFTTKLGEKGSQSASSILNGPGGQISEFAALYQMSQRRMPVMLAAAKSLFEKTRILNLDAPVRGDIWPNALALYRAGGERKWLDVAVKGADAYIARRLSVPQHDFSDPDSRGMFFWTSYAPNWAEMQLLYEETGEERFLAAAVEGARRFAQFVMLCPSIPAGDVLVNEGGVAPAYRPGLARIRIPEELAPAWRLSEIGLTPESAPTCKGHRAVFLACHAPWMLRLGLLANDAFLHDIARSAVVGRYTTFPGYHINSARTTVYEKPDFPLRPMAELNGTTSMHYNHIWAQIAMVTDYLVSDAFYRSGGRIAFPGHYAEGYAYVQCKVYGDRPGAVYDEKAAWLWMPKGLVAIDNIQVNYLAARGGDRLYLVLMNQSAGEVNAQLTLAGSLVDCAGERDVRVWKQNEPAAPARMSGGAVSVGIAGNGITVLAIDARVEPKFQQKIVTPARSAAGPGSVDLAFGGGARGMILDFGSDLASAYVYTKATYEVFKDVALHYRAGDQWQAMTDTKYPYEFTVPLVPGGGKFEFYLEGNGLDGAIIKSETAVLER